MESHMRHFRKFSAASRGMYIPEGRKGRKVVVIDVRPTASSRMADIFLQVTPGHDFEIASVLRAMLKGLKLEGLDEESLVGGVALSRWRELLELVKKSRYGVILYGIGLTQSRGKDLNLEQVITLVNEINRTARFCIMPMRGHANVNGSNQVLTWQTGYPFAINYNRGYPRFNPGEFSVVDMLKRKDIDAALIVATDPGAHLPQFALRYLQSVPTILLEPTITLSTSWANVVIPVAPAGGCAEHITAWTCSLRLKKIVDFPYPSDVEVLQAIKERVRHAKITNGQVYDPANG